MGQSIAGVGVLVAFLAAALRWDFPSSPAVRQARIDQAIAQGITHLAPASPLKTKPTVKNKIRIVKSFGDNSNSSDAALGLRASFLPGDAPSWLHRAAWRLEGVNRSLTSSLKELARKSILGRVS